jgi:HK97 family phage prohead protease
MRDYMIVPMTVKSMDEDNDYYYVNAFASTYGNIDLGGDRAIAGCFSDDLKENGNERSCLWQHNTREPIGINKYTDSLKGLMFTAKMPKSDDFVSKRVMPQIKVGSVKSASIGYDAINSQFNEIDKCRDLKKCKLYETSFVTFPMNPKAVILSVKHALDNIETPEYKTYTTQEKSYLKQFAENLDFKDEVEIPMLDDRTDWNKDKATGYLYKDKLPYCYTENGQLKIVPKALYAIVGILSGKSEINIPDQDKKEIKNKINKYYKKLGKEMPFKEDSKCFVDLDTIKMFLKRDLYKIFENNELILSNNAKDYVIKSLNHPESDEAGDKSDIIAECEKINKFLKGDK